MSDGLANRSETLFCPNSVSRCEIVTVFREGLSTIIGSQHDMVKHVSYHTFRHTFGTLLNANGENPKVEQKLLRHASLRVTTDVYMQAVSPQKREAQGNLVRLVRKGAASQAASRKVNERHAKP
jgi:site-specific recombinase XerD